MMGVSTSPRELVAFGSEKHGKNNGKNLTHFGHPRKRTPERRYAPTTVRLKSDWCPTISDWVSEIIGMRTLTMEGQQHLNELEAQGHTVLAVATDDEVAGLIAVRDVLRPEAREAVARLREQSIRLVMLTGDNPRAARVIASEAGVGEAHAALLWWHLAGYCVKV